MEGSFKMLDAQIGNDGGVDGSDKVMVKSNGLHSPERTGTDYTENRKTNNGGDGHGIHLVETFYVTSKKNTVYYVKLTEKGLTLRKETNVSAKEQVILLQDIIGCRCLRSKRKRKNNSSCTCAALPGPAELNVVEENSLDLDESDVSVYLYIYAYILEKNGHRERTTITLRFRSFDNYEQNNDEAQKWRSAIKYLLHSDPNALANPSRMKRFVNNSSTISPPVNVTPPAHSVPVPPVSPYQVYIPKDMRKVLILLNPKSGSGKARETFQKYVAPVFTEAEVPYELQVTKHANFAREFARRCAIHEWRWIVVVGGDGIYYEVINGLFERADWEHAIQAIPIGIIPCGSGNGLARAIAHAYSEPYDPKPVLNAALTVVRGHSAPMDLVRVETKSEILFSFLSVGWGFISDIDIESERLRSIGYQRFAIWSMHRLINLRTYYGTLSYLPAKNQNNISTIKYAPPPSSTTAAAPTPNHYHRRPKYQQQQSMSSLRQSMSYNGGLSAECCDCRGLGDCDACDSTFNEILTLETTASTDAFNNNNNSNNNNFKSNSDNHNGYKLNGVPYASPFRPRMDSWHSVHSKKSTYFSTSESVYHSVDGEIDGVGGGGGDLSMSNYGSQIIYDERNPIEQRGSHQIYGPASKLPALTAPVPSDWTIETGEFIMVHAAYQSFIASDCNFAPLSQLNDGIIWMLVIRAGASRQEIFKFLIGMSSGTHIPSVPNQHIEMIPVTAFRIEPMATANGQGHFTVDGERIEYGPIQAEIFSGLSKVLVPKAQQ